MAGVDTIKNEILQEAEETAKGIIADAEAAKTGRIETAKAELADATAKNEVKAKADAAAHISRAEAKAESESRRAVLSARSEVINDVIEKAYEKLKGRDSASYFAMLIDMVGAAAHGEEGTIVLSPADMRRLPSDFENNVNKAAAAKGGSLKLDPAGDPSIDRSTRTAPFRRFLRAGRRTSRILYTGSFGRRSDAMGDNYIFAVARIRVLEKSLLTDSDIAQMSGMSDADAVTAYLSDKGWGDENTGRDPQKMLAAEQVKTDKLIRSLGVGDDILSILSISQVYHNLKTAIKDVCVEGDSPYAYYEHPVYNAKYFTDILQEKNYRALPAEMQKPAEEAMNVMLEHHDGQKSDVIIDRACLDYMEARAKKSKYPILRDYLERTVAVTDVKIAVRGARTGKTYEYIRDALAPCRTLDRDILAKAASENEESLLNYLSGHGMAEAADALKTSITAFEKWCDDSIIESIRPEKTHPFTIGPVVAFYLGRMNEISTVRVLLTAKKNGFPEEAVKERARRMYG